MTWRFYNRVCRWT